MNLINQNLLVLPQIPGCVTLLRILILCATQFSCSKLKAMFPCPGQHHNSCLLNAHSQGEDSHKNTPLSTLDHLGFAALQRLQLLHCY